MTDSTWRAPLPDAPPDDDDVLRRTWNIQVEFVTPDPLSMDERIAVHEVIDKAITDLGYEYRCSYLHQGKIT